jgi:hypothetical protein
MKPANVATTEKTRPSFARFCTATAVLMMCAAHPALAEESDEELAKLAQNPVGNLISVPFQNNANLNLFRTVARACAGRQS